MVTIRTELVKIAMGMVKRLRQALAGKDRRKKWPTRMPVMNKAQAECMELHSLAITIPTTGSSKVKPCLKSGMPMSLNNT